MRLSAPTGALRTGCTGGWMADVTMNEGRDRTRLDNGPHNLAVL